MCSRTAKGHTESPNSISDKHSHTEHILACKVAHGDVNAHHALEFGQTMVKWRECMEKNWLKVSGAKTENLQTAGDTDPVRMMRHMEIDMINLPTVQSFK